MPPITEGVDVTQVERLLLPELDISDGASDLAGHECTSTTRTLVVEQDSVAGVHAVSLAVVDSDPVGV